MKKYDHKKIRRVVAVFLVLAFVLGSILSIVSLVFASEAASLQADSSARKPLNQELFPRLEINIYDENDTDFYGPWSPPEFTQEDIVYEHYSKEQFEDALDQFAESLGVSRETLDKTPESVPSKDAMQKALQELLDAYDYYVTQYSFISYLYSSDVTHEEHSQELAHMKNLSGEIFNLLLESLQSVQRNEALASHFNAILGEKKARELAETTTLTERQLAIRHEQTELEHAYDALSNEARNKDKDWEAMGNIYLALVELRNEFARESGYKNYLEWKQEETFGRDYTTEDLENYYEAIKTQMPRLHLYLSFKLDWDAVEDITFSREQELLEVPVKYLPFISSELMDSYQYLVDAKLHKQGIGEHSEQVSYTMSVPSHGSAMIYQYPYPDFYSFSTLIHEFGHFNTAVRESEGSFFAQSNIDIAEIHSQGLELLFMPFYRDIFGERYAQDAIDRSLNDLVHSMLSGAMYNEFETYAHTTEHLTVEGLNEKFVALSEEYSLGYRENTDWMFYHMYHAPFYYLSYSISAMAAGSLVPEMLRDYDEAINKYLDLSSYGEEAYDFRALLKETRFMDIFKVEAIELIAQAIYHYVNNPMFIDGEAYSEELERRQAQNQEETQTTTSLDPEADGTRPTINLPEYGSKTDPTDNRDSTPSTSVLEPEPSTRNDEDNSDLVRPGPEDYYHSGLWNGEGNLRPWQYVRLLPDLIRYALSGELWSDLWSAFKNSGPQQYS